MTDENLSGVAPAEDAAPLPETPVTEDQVEGDESESSADEHDADGEPKKIGGVTKRINEITAARREAERRAERLEQQNAELVRKLLQTGEQKQPEPTAQTHNDDPEPTLDKFQTYEEFVKATGRWEARQEYRAQQQQEQQRVESQRLAEAEMQFQQRLRQAESQIPDFEQVVGNPSLRISQEMVDMLRNRSDGPQVLYALGKDPAESARIASLPLREAAVELGGFIKAMSIPQPKTRTSAPPPVEPLTGGIGTQPLDPDKLSDDEWPAWRRQQLKR